MANSLIKEDDEVYANDTEKFADKYDCRAIFLFPGVTASNPDISDTYYIIPAGNSGIITIRWQSDGKADENKDVAAWTMSMNIPSSDNNTNLAAYDAMDKNVSLLLELSYGEILEAKTDPSGNQLIVKTKIEPSYNDKATVDQNYYIIEDIIKHNNVSSYSNGISYWAVADMTDGSEGKVVSFDLPQAVVQKIANGDIAAIEIEKYADR